MFDQHRSIWIARIATACIAGVLAACGADSEPETVAQPQTSVAASNPAPTKPDADDPVARMARAVGGKTGAAVELRYEIAAKPQVGAPTEMQLALIPSSTVDSMKLTIRGMEGLTLAGSLSAGFEVVEPGKPYLHSFSMLPEHPGVYYISVVIDTRIGPSSVARTFSIPFAVDNPAAEQPANPAREKNGQTGQSTKATERPKS